MQLPIRMGKQEIHSFPDFTQSQLRHIPFLLQRQQDGMVVIQVLLHQESDNWLQWRIQDLREGVLKGQVPARGRVREGNVPPPARSAEAFGEILYLIYEAS